MERCFCKLFKDGRYVRKMARIILMEFKGMASARTVLQIGAFCLQNDRSDLNSQFSQEKESALIQSEGTC